MNKKGLTLIELLGAVVIFGLMMSLISIVISFVLRANDRVVEQSRATRVGTLLIEDIQDTLNEISPTSYQFCGDNCVTLITAYEQIVVNNQIVTNVFDTPRSNVFRIENNSFYLNQISYDFREFELSNESEINLVIDPTNQDRITVSFKMIIASEANQFIFETQKTYILP